MYKRQAREFWSGEVLEVSDGVLLRTVQPHTVQVFALRRREERPQYLGGNRHLLQGAVEVLGLAWDDETRTLSLDYDAAAGSARAPFIHRLYFHLPAGWELEQAGAARAALEDEVQGWEHPGVWPMFGFAVCEEWLQAKGAMRYAQIGEATLRATRARVNVDTIIEKLETEPESFLKPDFLEWLARARAAAQETPS